MYPVKKVTWIMDSHGIFISFLVTDRWQLGPNWRQNPWLFHVIYPGSICSPCRNMTWIYCNFKSWNLLRKWRDFHRISCHFRPNAVKKTWEKPCHIFYRVSMLASELSYVALRVSRMRYWIKFLVSFPKKKRKTNPMMA